MFPSLHLPRHHAIAGQGAPELTLAQRLTRWLLRCWHAECRWAERADRFVPYY